MVSIQLQFQPAPTLGKKAGWIVNAEYFGNITFVNPSIFKNHYGSVALGVIFNQFLAKSLIFRVGRDSLQIHQGMIDRFAATQVRPVAAHGSPGIGSHDKNYPGSMRFDSFKNPVKLGIGDADMIFADGNDGVRHSGGVHFNFV